MTRPAAAAQPDITAVPAGWWMRPAGSGPADPADPAFAALPDPDGAVTVIAGASGGALPSASTVAALLLALPVAHQDDVVVAVHGCEPTDAPAGTPGLPGQVADLIGRPVLAQHGLLLPGPGGDASGAAHVVAFDGTAEPAWRPLVRHCLHVPGTGPTVTRWSEPAPGFAALGAGDYRVADGWFVRLVPAGFVLRREGEPPDTVLDAAPFHPARLDLAVDHPPGGLPDGVLAALGRLADALPGPARRRLRVVLPPGTGPAEAQRVRWAVPAPQHIRLPVPDVSRGVPRGVDDAANGGADANGGDAANGGADATAGRTAAPGTALAVTASGRMRLVSPAPHGPCG
ncbi:hypothetical protein [Parafrankia elaeagni]|uniref:hypothetical protein n=1 Tax=Parafrankia elaeagni TaxID=222534 RepID=UPI0012B62EF3|nr:hypothetical protein [Parafrankia elaeagni]